MSINQPYFSGDTNPADQAWQLEVTEATNKLQYQIDNLDIANSVASIMVVYSDSANQLTNTQSEVYSGQDYVAYYGYVGAKPSVPIREDISFAQFKSNIDSTFIIYRRTATVPATPTATTYDTTTNSLTVPALWSTAIPEQDGIPIYVSQANVTGLGTLTCNWSVPILFVADGQSVGEGLVYYDTASTSAPATPSATDYDFNLGGFTGLSAGWQAAPVEVIISDTTTKYWTSKYHATKAPGDSTATISFLDPVGSINFGDTIQSDNYVAGSAGWQIERTTGDAEFNNVEIRGGLITPSIVSAAIESKSITADQIDVDTLVIGSKNILTIDGEDVAVKTHRRVTDDYTDGLDNLVVGGGTANGTSVTGVDANTDLRYRFDVQVQTTSGSNTLRTKRYYYPLITAASGYSIEDGNVEFFTIDDITSAQSTDFYVGTNSVDFYSAGTNGNSRQEVLGIGTSMYLNQAELLTPIDPAIEFKTTGTARFEIKLTADGTTTPSFTVAKLTAYAVNVEEIFSHTGTASGSFYTFNEDFETVVNVQLTGTSSTVPYLSDLSATQVKVYGSGTVYGVARGY